MHHIWKCGHHDIIKSKKWAHCLKLINNFFPEQLISNSYIELNNNGNNIGNRPLGQAVTHSSLEREVRGSNFEPVKSYTVLPTIRHRCDISSKEAVLPGRNDAEIGPVNSLHVSA